MSSSKYAGFWKRMGAFLIDCLLLALAIIGVDVMLDIAVKILAIGIKPLQGMGGRITHNVLLLPMYILVPWHYYTRTEASEQQGSIGKQVMGLKITDYDGCRISFTHANGRFFSRIVTHIANLFMFAGILPFLFTEKKQVLHELMTETVVIEVSDKAPDATAA